MVYVVLSIAAISFIYPFIWMMGAAFAPMHEIGKMTVWPSHPGWGNFKSLIEKIPIVHSLVISLFVGIFYNILGIDNRVDGWICFG